MKYRAYKDVKWIWWRAEKNVRMIFPHILFALVLVFSGMGGGNKWSDDSKEVSLIKDDLVYVCMLKCMAVPMMRTKKEWE